MGDRTTAVRGEWVIGYQDGEHRLIRDGVVVYRGHEIVYVGPEWTGEVDEVLGGKGCLVIPGLISTHTHFSAQNMAKIILDGGRRCFVRSGFLNVEPRKIAGGPGFGANENLIAGIKWAMATMMRSGITTAVEGGGLAIGREIVDLGGEAGLRVYYSPTYSGANYYFDEKGMLIRKFVEDDALRQMERAVEFIKDHDGAHGGLFKGMLLPNEFYISTPRILQETKEAAKGLGVGITLHVSEQLFEFHETVRQTGRTPVGVLDDLGFLGPEVIIGHCVYVDGHRLTAFPFSGDLEALAKSGATVAHAPVAWARRGVMLENFDRYRLAGVNVGIGTDTYPNDIIEEMRIASLACKLATTSNEAGRYMDVFNSATLSGAKALQRDDIGRLAEGAKADIVVVRLDTMRVGVVYDPLQSLIHEANSELVERVIIDGRTVVEGGAVKAWDAQALLGELRQSTERVWSEFSDSHWTGQTVTEAFPPALKEWQGGRS
jgi:cytosine/adenosine deaminase-related metal-dependent hydrolase